MTIKITKGAKIGAVVGLVIHIVWHNVTNVPLLAPLSSHLMIGLVTVGIGAFIGSKLIK